MEVSQPQNRNAEELIEEIDEFIRHNVYTSTPFRQDPHNKRNQRRLDVNRKSHVNRGEAAESRTPNPEQQEIVMASPARRPESWTQHPQRRVCPS